jgi:hypothetical protein
VAVGLDRDVLAEGEVSDGVLGLLAECLAILGAGNPAEADAFGMVAIQYFDGVAVD